MPTSRRPPAPQLAHVTLLLLLVAVACAGCTRSGPEESIVPPTTDATTAAEPIDPAATVVSLTFDDGLATQLVARDVLAEHRMTGTFYVNSGLLDTPGYMTLAQVQGLQAKGFEVGGHTRTHANVVEVAPARLRDEICGDREALQRAGLEVRSFAYPEGAVNDAARLMTRSCGYASARVVGGLRSGADCAGCPPAESIPPQRTFLIRTPTSVRATTTLAQMQQLVVQAEQDGGGGWVPMVFHEVCAPTDQRPRCAKYAVRTPDFEAFVAWLAARTDGPSPTIVRTVGDVVEAGEAR